jgi:carbon storage regulator
LQEITAITHTAFAELLHCTNKQHRLLRSHFLDELPVTRGLPPAGLPHTREVLMLVVAREVGEALKIGDEITVTFLRVHGGYVRIGIAAPKEVLVLRGELHGKTAQESEVKDDDRE